MFLKRRGDSAILNADSNIIAEKANIPLKIAEDIHSLAKQFQMEQKSK